MKILTKSQNSSTRIVLSWLSNHDVVQFIIVFLQNFEQKTIQPRRDSNPKPLSCKQILNHLDKLAIIIVNTLYSQYLYSQYLQSHYSYSQYLYRQYDSTYIVCQEDFDQEKMWSNPYNLFGKFWSKGNTVWAI